MEPLLPLWSPPWQELQEEEEEKILHGLLYNSDPGFVFIPTNVLTGLKNQSCYWLFLSRHLLFLIGLCSILSSKTNPFTVKNNFLLLYTVQEFWLDYLVFFDTPKVFQINVEIQRIICYSLTGFMKHQDHRTYSCHLRHHKNLMFSWSPMAP